VRCNATDFECRREETGCSPTRRSQGSDDGLCYKAVVETVDAPHVTNSDSSIRAVLEWYRRRITLDRFGKRFLPIPAELAGWVLAEPGEASEAGGLRPLGEVRELLRELIDTAELGERERFVVCARFGLTEYPAANPVRQLRHRLSMVRERGGDGASERQLRHLTLSAIQALDRTIVDRGLSRPGERPVDAGPVDDPATASWFRSRVSVDEQEAVFERAVHEARVFACLAGLSDEVTRVLDEIDAYHAEAVVGLWPPRADRRLGRSRARALVSLALWDLIYRDTATSVALEPARTGILREPSTSVAVVADSLGSFLAGDWSDEVVLPACEAVLALAGQDRTAASIACDLLLGAYGTRGKRRLSDIAEATVLRTAVQLRAGDADPTAVALALRAYADRPLHWQTVDSLQKAVKVASAYGCFRVADDLCDRVDAILAEPFRVAEDRILEIDRVEWQLFTHHQRSGTLRRRLDEGAGLAELKRALAEQDAAERNCERAYENAQAGAPNDVTDRWNFFLAVRAAELRLIGLKKLSSGPSLTAHLSVLDPALDRAADVAERERYSGVEYVPLIKVHLAIALAANDLQRAAELLRELHKLGWPLARTLPEIVAIYQPTPRRARAPHPLCEAVDEVAGAQREPSWKAAVADRASGWRRARARLLGR
jgi:hypothetical protein